MDKGSCEYLIKSSSCLYIYIYIYFFSDLLHNVEWQIRQKLKDYGVEGVENITVVSDAQHEGRSRGFAFLEFACHADAMLAYKRLQKPDVVFGHPERTAKVAFAEPIREPDPEIMAQVKTIFLDGLPPHWDEDRVRECLKGYGEIVRVVLARNMSTAKRKDFGFVDFSTHDDAVACIEGINNREFGNGNTKVIYVLSILHLLQIMLLCSCSFLISFCCVCSKITLPKKPLLGFIKLFWHFPLT
jgi:RNA recognition motif-containing protein